MSLERLHFSLGHTWKQMRIRPIPLCGAFMNMHATVQRCLSCSDHNVLKGSHFGRECRTPKQKVQPSRELHSIIAKNAHWVDVMMVAYTRLEGRAGMDCVSAEVQTRIRGLESLLEKAPNWSGMPILEVQPSIEVGAEGLRSYAVTIVYALTLHVDYASYNYAHYFNSSNRYIATSRLQETYHASI